MINSAVAAFLAMQMLAGVPKADLSQIALAKTAPPVAALKRPQTPEETFVDLQASGADLATMLKMLSAQTHVGLVLLSTTDVKFSTNLVHIPFIDALRHLCALTGLSYLKVGTTYVVAAKDKLKDGYADAYYKVHPEEKPASAAPAEELVTEVYISNYVSSSQLAESLTSIFTKEKLVAIAGPVQSNPSVSAQDASSTTGTQSSALTKDDAAVASSAKMLVLRGGKDVVALALALAKKMDSMRAQVAIEVTIHDISDNALKDLGVSWTFGDINIKETDPRGVNFGSFGRVPLTFNGVIKALESQDKAKLLASPNVSVLDGERAFILIGDRINFPVLVGYSQNNAPIFSKEEERVGIYMQVAASVSSDDNVTLSLYPQVSTVTGFLNVNGASYPQISTREAQTTLRVRSGETIVMGGLMKSEETASYDRVPILSDLPFLGQIFRHRKTTKSSSQVIISITPRVIRTDESR